MNALKTLLATTAATLAWCSPSIAQPTAAEILEKSGIKGGLIVHLGCGDGRFTAALHANDRYLVHGLDPSPKAIERARKHIHDKGLYGAVSVESLNTHVLPYGDNIVNLLVVSDDGCGVQQAEMERVLCPGGVAIRVAQNSPASAGEIFIRKPWPEEIDEWTHFLHDASGNAVANDTRVASPRHLQWSAGPKRTRDHDALASFTTMTSSGGRLFYILDEGPTSQIHRPAEWRLVARDAFNGVPLWKRKIDSWVTHLYNFRAGPVQMTRRLVSAGDRVFVTLGYNAAVTALDAASGDTLLTYEGSENTEEIILHNDVLLTILGDPTIFEKEAPNIEGYWETTVEGEGTVAKSIAAYRASTGELLWKNSDPAMANLVPLSLCAGGDQAFYLDKEHLHCLSIETGEKRWSAPCESEGLFLRNYAPTVVSCENVIVCLSIKRLAAFSAENGRLLWNKDKGYLGFGSPGDLFVVDGQVWTFPGKAGIRYASKDGVMGATGQEFAALDLRTGEVMRAISKDDVWPGGHHHRCYRNKATRNFAICGRRGLEFVDLTGGGDNVINWWVRGICQYGIMPCNGLVYAPPDPCRCFSPIKVDGLLALAADCSLDARDGTPEPPLRKGPACTRHAGAPDPPAPSPEDWPTYRHDITRSGATASAVPGNLKQQWATDLGEGKLSSAVVAGNRLMVSAIDQQTVYCLDAGSGEQLWKFSAGGRVDSPPTVSGNLAVFGSRDGRVYAVDATDGQLAWSFRAGPRDRRIVGDGRLESAWPIHGSVLVLDGTAYFAAGRSSFLDGGIRLYGLDLNTGETRCETVVESVPVDGNNSGALPDILVSDGTSIAMRQQSFNRQLEQGEGPRFTSFSATTGFLAPEWGHRLTWSLAKVSGNLLVFDDLSVYGAASGYLGWKKNRENWPPTHTGHLHQKYSRYEPEWFPVGNRLVAGALRATKEPPPKQAQDSRKKSRQKRDTQDGGERWALDLPIQVRAMVLAGDTLFAAGWPDAVTALDQPGSYANKPVSQGPRLWAISTENGNTLAEHKLDAPPVFDGTIAADGKLFVTLQNGKVICFGGK